MRRYGDEEVKAILRLAMGEGAQSAAQDGLTLDELVRVASEAGLDPERVRSAAERYESGETSDRAGDSPESTAQGQLADNQSKAATMNPSWKMCF